MSLKSSLETVPWEFLQKHESPVGFRVLKFLGQKSGQVRSTGQLTLTPRKSRSRTTLRSTSVADITSAEFLDWLKPGNIA